MGQIWPGSAPSLYANAVNGNYAMEYKIRIEFNNIPVPYLSDYKTGFLCL